MQSPQDLGALFAALREAKILVGPREVLRIHEILTRAEHLDVHGLRSILVAVLAKSHEEKQRFDDVFRLYVQGQTDKRMPLDPPTPIKPSAPNLVATPSPVVLATGSSRRTRLFFGGAIVAVVGGVFVAAHCLSRSEVVENVDAGAYTKPVGSVSSHPIPDKLDAGLEEQAPTPEQLYPDAQDWREDFADVTNPSVKIAVTAPEVQTDKRTFSAYAPRIEIQQQSFFTSSSGGIAGIGILAIALGLIVSRWGLRQKLLPPRAPAPNRQGPRELPLSSPVARDLELLDMQSEDALVWGVGRFVTEEVTANLDVEKSVLATVAAAGRPELRFERRGRHRQVCLWIDESARDPAIERLGREVALALSRVGLDVNVARFWAVPDKLVRQDGTIVSATAMEEELAFSIVAILTDGHALTTRHAGADRRLGISRLMRMFARLPRLAFVDFGEGPSRASRIARAYGITAVCPDEAAAFLALGRKPEVRDAPTRKLTGDATAWAAACALPMRLIDEETAYDVRRALRLSVSPWSWSVVRQSGRQAGEWVEWLLEKRAELLDWLRCAEYGAEKERVAPNSLLGKTIAYWKSRLDAEDVLRRKNDAQEPWVGTPAERTLRIDRVFLDLWEAPEEAVKVLYSFVGTDAERVVQEKLGAFGPLEAEGTRSVIVLPWRFAGLSSAAQAMFERLGFGAKAGVRQDKLEGDLVERRGRLWMGLGLACGLGVGAIASGVNSWQTAAFPCELDEGDKAIGAWCEQIENWQGKGSRLVAGGWRGFSAQKEANRTDLPTLRLERQQVPCEGTDAQGWFWQRCGAQLPLEKPTEQRAKRRKIFVLQGNSTDERIRSFGKTLLDRSAADVVLIRAEATGAGELNEWTPMLNVDKDKLVLVHFQEGPIDGTTNAPDLKFERYIAQLPKKTRQFTLPDKPRKIWWDNANNAIVFDEAGRLIAVDESNEVLRPSVSTAEVPVKWIVVDPNNAAKVLETADGKVYFQATMGKPIPLTIPGGPLVGPVVWSSNGQRFAGISSIGSVLYWDLVNPEPYVYPAAKGFVPNAVAWSLNGSELFVGTPEGVTMLSRQEDPISFGVTQNVVSDIVGPVASKYVLISAQSGLVTIAGSNQVQQGPPSLEPLREIRAKTGSISPDGNSIATVHEGGKIRISTMDTNTMIEEFACETSLAPAWSLDGQRLLVVCGKMVYDRPVFSPIFGLKDVKGVCPSREKLTADFGVDSAEAAVIHSHCDPSADD